MSMQEPINGLPGQGTGSAADVVTQLQGVVRQLSEWVRVFTGRIAYGSFTLGAAATTTVQNTAVKGNSLVVFTPTNAAAATLMGSTQALYISAIAAGTSFTVATADATAAAGTETFSYSINTPS